MPDDRQSALADVLTFVERMGKQQGRGPVGRFVLATFLCTRAHDDDRVIVPEDADEIWQAMKRGSGNDHPDIAQDLVHFIVLGRRNDLDGPVQLELALQRLIHLKDRNQVPSQKSWDCIRTFARHQSTAKRPMTTNAIDLLLKRTGKQA